MCKICYIFGAAPLDMPCPHPSEGDFVIAADGGFAHTEALGIRADLVLGDFDSLAGGRPRHPNTETFPIRKDDTDMHLAVLEGLRQGHRTFCLYGGTGGRTDHTIANYHTLAYLARQGARGYLIGGGFTATVLSDGTLRFPSCIRGNFSVFAWGGEAATTLRGLSYEAERITLCPTRPLGVSNAFLPDKSAEIICHEGMLLLLWEGDTLPQEAGGSEIPRHLSAGIPNH